MKSTITTFLSATMLALITAMSSMAQNANYEASMDLKSFDEIRVISDTEVIIIKSDRNHLKLVGDSSFVFNMPVTQNDGALTLVYEENGQNKLQKAVIEYKAINRLVTGGKGSIHIQGLNEKELKVYNNTANLTMKGRTDNVSLYSQEGDNDISDLRAFKITAYIGDNAKLLRPKWYRD